MLNINLKIETKRGYVINNEFITFSDMPRSQELRLYYQIFEENFLKKFQRKKESKKLKRKVNYSDGMTKRQIELSLKISKLCNSQLYLEKKISFLTYPFPKEEVYNERMKIQAHLDRVKAIVAVMKDEVHSIYFQ